MPNRRALLNLVTALLIVGGVLILVAWAGPSTNVPMTLLAVGLATLHLAAALGTVLRRRWGRIMGLVVGWIGVFGSGGVVVSLVPALPSLLVGSRLDDRSWLAALAVSAVLLAVYLVILLVLLNNRTAFDPGSQLG